MRYFIAQFCETVKLRYFPVLHFQATRFANRAICYAREFGEYSQSSLAIRLPD